MKSTSKYPQATCEGGHRKIRIYYKCSPGILQCNLCFTTHCMKDDSTIVESDCCCQASGPSEKLEHSKIYVNSY